MDLNASHLSCRRHDAHRRAPCSRLRTDGFRRLVGAPPDEPDLTDAGRVDDFFAWARPQYVFLAAGKSGGIGANQSRPADLMLDNLLVAAHVIDEAHRSRRHQTAVPGELVHLSAARAATDAARIAADRPAGADQRRLCRRPSWPAGSCARRIAGSTAPASSPPFPPSLRADDDFSPRKRPRHSRSDAPDARGQAAK